MDINQSGLTVFRLPRSHWHCTLFNVEWAAVKPSRLQPHVLQFLSSVKDGQAPHLILTGAPGIGKTHIGIGIYRAVAAVWGTELATWLNVPAFCERVKRAYDASTLDPWYDIESAKRLIVLDDLFGKELSPHEKDAIVTRLLDTAYQNNAAVVVTMNPSVEELKTRLPPHEISRLLAEHTGIPMTADKDRRR